jgi:hypothetical protein
LRNLVSHPGLPAHRRNSKPKGNSGK